MVTYNPVAEPTRHLIVNLAQSGGHLVGQSTGYDHDVGLSTSASQRWE